MEIVFTEQEVDERLARHNMPEAIFSHRLAYRYGYGDCLKEMAKFLLSKEEIELPEGAIPILNDKLELLGYFTQKENIYWKGGNRNDEPTGQG